MCDGFKVAPCGRVSKDLFTQGAPVEAAIDLQNPIAEALSDCFQSGSTRRHDLARDHIAVNHGHAVGGE
jgi:hypothetical protein